jgi:hypothetical protein
MNWFELALIEACEKLEAKRDKELKDFCWNNCIVAEGKSKPGALTFSQVAARFHVSRQQVVAVVLSIAKELDEMGAEQAATDAKLDAYRAKGEADAEFRAQASTGSPLADAARDAGIPVKVVDFGYEEGQDGNSNQPAQ